MKNPNQKHFQPMFDKIAKENKKAAEKRETTKSGEIAKLREEIALLKAEKHEAANSGEVAELREEIALLKAEIKKLKK